MKNFKCLCLTLGFLAIAWTGLSACVLENNRLLDRIKGADAIYDYRQKVGASAHELLSADRFKSLVVEIQAVPGFAPSQDALNRLQEFLKTYLNKPSGIDVLPTETIRSPGKPRYTLTDVLALEDQFRHHFTTKDQLVVYVLFLDGPSADDTGTSKLAGQAYRNMSIVIYEKSLLDLQSASVSRWWLEATILAHEFGHLLGLVNQATPALDASHVDPAHPDHCANDKCLMHFKADSGSVVEMNPGDAIPPLDDSCHHDLTANGGK